MGMDLLGECNNWDDLNMAIWGEVCMCREIQVIVLSQLFCPFHLKLHETGLMMLDTGGFI